MRFLTWFLIWTIVPMTAVYAVTPTPSIKPVNAEKTIKEKDNENTTNVFSTISKPPKKPQPSTFETIISDAIDLVVGDKNDVIIPPALPDEKQRPQIAQSVETFTIDGNATPLPIHKPFHVTTNQPTTLNEQLRKKQSADDSVVIRYQSNNYNDRTAGRSPSVPTMNNTERAYAQKIERLRETDDESPFKTDILPKAANQSMSDPIILFFKDDTSEMEVGQMAILRDDVLKPLNRSTSRTVIIEGYASLNKSIPDETRRLSLGRALMIREFLIDNRIKASRIDVRAMSDDTPISPKDRVDIILSR